MSRGALEYIVYIISISIYLSIYIYLYIYLHEAISKWMPLLWNMVYRFAVTFKHLNKQTKQSWLILNTLLSCLQYNSKMGTSVPDVLTYLTFTLLLFFTYCWLLYWQCLGCLGHCPLLQVPLVVLCNLSGILNLTLYLNLGSR